jgi:hypothetical protein
MNGNGSGAIAALAARVAELEAAHKVLLRAVEDTYRTRLLMLEQDVDRIAAELATLLRK